MLSCIGLVLAFRTSSNLAAAYGVAVSLTMLITTIMFYFVARYRWNWKPLLVLPLCLTLALIELTFLCANLVKFFDGGWVPLFIAILIFTLMSTWAAGRRLLRIALERGTLSQELLIQSLALEKIVHVPGTAVFMTSTGGRTPVALLHSLKHYQAIHERVIFLTVTTEDQPWVPPNSRVQVEQLGDNYWRVTGHFGFMQQPNVPRLLRQCAAHNLIVDPLKTTFFLGREIIVQKTTNPSFPRWRGHLFALASRLAQQPATYFHIPVDRVIELGQQIEL